MAVEQTTQISVAVGLLTAITLYQGGICHWGLTPTERRRLPVSQERDSLNPFNLLYVSSGTFLLYEVAAAFGKFIFFLLQLNGTLKHRWDKMEISRTQTLKRLTITGKSLAVVGILCFLQSRWDLKVLRCLDSVQEREPENWWRYRAQVQVLARFSRAWWRAMAEVYIELVNNSIYLTVLAAGIFITKEIICPFLIWMEMLLSDLLARAWRRSWNPPQATCSNPTVVTDLQNHSESKEQEQQEPLSKSEIKNQETTKAGVLVDQPNTGTKIEIQNLTLHRSLNSLPTSKQGVSAGTGRSFSNLWSRTRCRIPFKNAERNVNVTLRNEGVGVDGDLGLTRSGQLSSSEEEVELRQFNGFEVVSSKKNDIQGDSIMHF